MPISAICAMEKNYKKTTLLMNQMNNKNKFVLLNNYNYVLVMNLLLENIPNFPIVMTKV